jgi:hypothetical protein
MTLGWISCAFITRRPPITKALAITMITGPRLRPGIASLAADMT